MARPTPAIVNAVAPARNVGGLPVMDTRGTYRIKQADLKDCLRIARGGPHQAELIATKRHYDGATGGEPGYYANVFIAFRIGRSTWRTQGVRVLPPEAARIARALKRGTSSRPPKDEEPRLSGTGSGAVTELRAEPVGASVLLFVRYFAAGPLCYVRSRGVEVRARERAKVAEGLLKLAKTGSRAK